MARVAHIVTVFLRNHLSHIIRSLQKKKKKNLAVYNVTEYDLYQ